MTQNMVITLTVGGVVAAALLAAYAHGQAQGETTLPGLMSPAINVTPKTYNVPGLTVTTGGPTTLVTPTPVQSSCLCGCDSVALTNLFGSIADAAKAYRNELNGMVNNYAAAVNKLFNSVAFQSTQN